MTDRMDSTALTDARLRSLLAARAARAARASGTSLTSRAVDTSGPSARPASSLAKVARSVTSEPQRRPVPGFPPTRLMGAGVGVAAVVALAVLGGQVFRPAPATAPGSTTVAGTAAASEASGPIESGPAGASATPGSATSPWTQLTWSRGAPDILESGNASVMGTIEHGTGFVAVGNTVAADGSAIGRMWITEDGQTWRATSPPALAGLLPQRILRAGERLVVLAIRETDDAQPVVEAIASADGLDWVSVPAPPVDLASEAGRAVGGPLGVFVPGAIRDWVIGPDLAEWTVVRHTSATPSPARGGLFAAGRDRWFWLGATGSTKAGAQPTVGAIWSSTDGRTWEPTVIDRPGGAVNEVHAVDGGYVAIGIDHGLPCDGCSGGIDLSRVAWSSVDGSTWTRLDTAGQRSGDPLFGAWIDADGHRLVAFANRFVVDPAAERGGIVSGTTDGRTWTPIAVDGAGGPRALVAFTVGPLGVVALDRVDRGPRQVEIQPWWASATTTP